MLVISVLLSTKGAHSVVLVALICAFALGWTLMVWLTLSVQFFVLVTSRLMV